MKPQINHVITFTAPGRIELAAQPLSTTPLGERTVAGPTVCSMISPGTELAGYQGQWTWANFPAVPGYAAVFEVAEVGSAVDDIKPGDLVFCMKGHQSWQRCERDEVIPVPPGLSPTVAPFARLMGVSMSTLTTSSARPPARVVVTGLGLVGHLAAKVFAASGYDVIGCDPSAARRELAARTGLRDVRPTVPLDDQTLVDQVALVIECSGHEQAALDACNIVQRRGEVVQLATPWQRKTDLTAHAILNAVFFRYVVLRSGWEWEVPLHPTAFRTNSIYGNIAGAMRWLCEGRVKVDGLAEVVSPQQASAAYEALRQQTSPGLTMIFDWANFDGK